MLFAGIYMLGYLHGHQNIIFEKGFQPKVVNLELGKPTTVDFSKYWEVYNTLSDKFIEPLDTNNAVEGTIKGLVESLNDPFSIYLTEKQSTEFLNDLNGTFEGIGAELTIKDGVISVVAPLNGSPAEKAGLKPKDIILKINGESTKDLALDQAVEKIRGKKGTKVKLSIISDGVKEPREIEIERDSIKADSVSLKIEDDIAIVKINQFGDDTTNLMNKSAKEINDTKNIKGIILDLRNNPGGLLESSIDISSLFIGNSSVIVIEKDRQGKQEEKKTTLEPTLKNYPLAVLVNAGSASASEIVAGAIQDNNRGKIIGAKTFGKGSVQDLIKLKDNSTIKLTVEKWLTPQGKTISGEGIAPDIETEDNPETEIDEAVQKAKENIKQ